MYSYCFAKERKLLYENCISLLQIFGLLTGVKLLGNPILYVYIWPYYYYT